MHAMQYDDRCEILRSDGWNLIDVSIKMNVLKAFVDIYLSEILIKVCQKFGIFSETYWALDSTFNVPSGCINLLIFNCHIMKFHDIITLMIVLRDLFTLVQNGVEE